MSIEQQLDSYVHEQMRQIHIPGLSLAVIQNGATIIAKNYGVANVELGVPTTSETVYEIFSMPKGFTAAAIMLLMADGKLSLDEPLARFRPDLLDAWQDESGADRVS
jgi:CubicO group peptidase (beta-lactamase class C family)